jgi:hypothetical protein
MTASATPTSEAPSDLAFWTIRSVNSEGDKTLTALLPVTDGHGVGRSAETTSLPDTPALVSTPAPLVSQTAGLTARTKAPTSLTSSGSGAPHARSISGPWSSLYSRVTTTSTSTKPARASRAT